MSRRLERMLETLSTAGMNRMVRPGQPGKSRGDGAGLTGHLSLVIPTDAASALADLVVVDRVTLTEAAELLDEAGATLDDLGASVAISCHCFQVASRLHQLAHGGQQ